MKDEGRVLHHLCWADDLYAMAGTRNHLTRNLEDMTNAIERLGMRWKEKSLTIVAQETQSTTRADLGHETGSYCCLSTGELPERCQGSQILEESVTWRCDE